MGTVASDDSECSDLPRDYYCHDDDDDFIDSEKEEEPVSRRTRQRRTRAVGEKQQASVHLEETTPAFPTPFPEETISAVVSQSPQVQKPGYSLENPKRFDTDSADDEDMHIENQWLSQIRRLQGQHGVLLAHLAAMVAKGN